jgi:hypothetical protein
VRGGPPRKEGGAVGSGASIRWRARLGAVAAAGLITGGGLGIAAAPASAAPTTVPDACQLLGAGDVQAVFGGQVDAGTADRTPDGSQTTCEFQVTKTKGSHTTSDGVLLSVYPQRTTGDFSVQRRSATGPTRTVRHLGDAAFSERAVLGGHVFDDLWVRRGPVQFRVEYVKDVGVKPLSKLALVVLDRLAAAGPTPST